MKHGKLALIETELRKKPPLVPNYMVILNNLPKVKLSFLKQTYATYPHALSGPIDLSIAEQTIAQYLDAPSKLEDICSVLQARGMSIDSFVVEKIANTKNDPSSNQKINVNTIEIIKNNINKALVKTDPTQAIKNEFQRFNTGDTIGQQTIVTAVEGLSDSQLKGDCGVKNSTGGVSNLTIAEQALYCACLSGNQQLFTQLYAELEKKGIKIDSAMLKNVSDSNSTINWIKEQLERWKNQELVKTDPQQAIFSEFQRLNTGSTINLEIIATAVQGLDARKLNLPCGVVNSSGTELTIAEQALYLACWNKNPLLFAQLYAELETKKIAIDSPMLKKISDSAPSHKGGMNKRLENLKNQELVKTEPEQAILSDFQRLSIGGIINPQTIATAVTGLSDSQLKLDCGVKNPTGGVSNLTIAEQALYYACLSGNQQLFTQLYAELEKKGIKIDSAMLKNISNSNSATKWIKGQLDRWKKQKLVQTEPQQAIRSEFKGFNTGGNVNPQIIAMAVKCLDADKLILRCDVKNPTGSATNLTIAEQALYYACLSDNQQLFAQLYAELEKKGIKIDSPMLKNISDSNTAITWMQERLELWRNQELVKTEPEQAILSEFQRLNSGGIINPQIIERAVQGLDVNKLNLPCGVVNSFGTELTIAEQALYLACWNKNPLLFAQLYAELETKKIAIDSPMLKKISDSAPSHNGAMNELLEHWKNQELVKTEPEQAILSEFQRLNTGGSINLQIIETAVKGLSDSQLKLDSGVNNLFATKLTIAEQVLRHACLTGNQKLFEQVCSELTKKGVIIDSTMAKKISKTLLFPMNMENYVLNQDVVKRDPQQAIINEFQRGLNALPSTILTALSDPRINLKTLYKKLTIAEQALGLACVTSNQKLFEQVCSVLTRRGVIINSMVARRVSNKLPPPMNKDNYVLNQNLVKRKPQDAIVNEFKRGSNALSSTILIALSDPKIDLKALYGGLTIEEQALHHAYDNNQTNPQLFEQVCLELKKKGITIDSQMVKKIVSNYAHQNHQIVENFINQELVKVDPQQAIINEFNRGEEANQDTIVTVLSKPGVNLKVDCCLGNGLSIEEQAVAQAYMLKNPTALDVIKKMGISNSQIQKIAKVHFSSYVDNQGFNCWMSQQLADIDLNTINKAGKPVIQDIAIIAEATAGTPIGEAISQGAPQPLLLMTALERQDMLNRLDSSITELMNEAENTHQANCHKPGTADVDPDYITRLGTNEFFFYTKEPLTEKEFEELQNKIATKAKTSSPGVQLILASFAVYASDGGVMNVTPHIACGNPPDFKLIVKNYTSSIDVRYILPDGVGGLIRPRPVDMKSPVTLPKIKIDGRAVDLSFDNVFNSRTYKGTEFLTAVDICLDHEIGVAKANTEKLTSKVSIAISHVVASNSINLQKDKHLGPNAIMHLDPMYSPQSPGCKENVTQTQIDPSKKLAFGGSFKRFDVEKCPILSNEDVLRASLSKALSSTKELNVTVTALTPFTIKLNDVNDSRYYFCLRKYFQDNRIDFVSKGDSIEIKDRFFHYPPPKNATATVSDVINIFYSSPGEKQRLLQGQEYRMKNLVRQFKDKARQPRRSDNFLTNLEIDIKEIDSKDKLDEFKKALIIPDYIKDKTKIKINEVFTQKEADLKNSSFNKSYTSHY